MNNDLVSKQFNHDITKQNIIVNLTADEPVSFHKMRIGLP